jgi:probable rRNA maturation factor
MATPPLVEIAFWKQCQLIGVDQTRVAAAIESIAVDYGVTQGSLSIAIVDDAFIRTVNNKHLQHDWPTDVISFLLSDDDEHFDGELVVSAETATRMAQSLPWTADDEFLLYCIHGMLHLVGLDDIDPSDAAEMRQLERHYLVSHDVPKADQHGDRVWIHNDANDSCGQSSLIDPQPQNRSTITK